ncbi:MAG: hypothetical protein HEP71_21135 [Roseivirga sp.]|nr:hypothetical protein [Roseivirga sp.]
MESACLFFDRGTVFRTRRIVTAGVFLLLSTVLSFSQNSNQTIFLDQNGQASINVANLDDCFEDTNAQPCTPSAAEGDDHAIWLSNNTFPGSSTDFLFENGAELLELANGTATITGTLYNTNNPTDRWQVELYLSDKMNWTDWSALGRSYKDERNLAGSDYLDWSYYIMDLTQDSKLTGLSANTGKTLILQHAPANYLYGFQVGNAANNKNAKYGFSGWFTYSWDGVNYHQGDFNLDLANCSPVDVEDCQCEGKMKNFTFTYNGTSGVDVKAFDKDGDLIHTFNNVSDGDDLTVNGFDFKGRLEAKTSIQVVGGTSYEVHTSCSEQIIGNVYGPFTVISYTDGEGNYCSGTQNIPVGNVTVSVDQENFGCDDIGDNTVTITSTDQNGNTCTEQIIVTVIEDILPVIVPLNINVDLDEDGEATVAANEVYTSITDNCSVVSIEVDPMEFDCDDLGDNTVTITATDANGNVATATAIVTVRDVTPPTVVTKILIWEPTGPRYRSYAVFCLKETNSTF